MKSSARNQVKRIQYSRKEKILEVSFSDGCLYELSAEFLRVHSPSAEVRGHGSGQEILQSGKSGVQIDAIEKIGHYAVQIIFDDGHDSGLFSWSYLRELGEHKDALWKAYLEKLAVEGKSRDPEIQVLNFYP